MAKVYPDQGKEVKLVICSVRIVIFVINFKDKHNDSCSCIARELVRIYVIGEWLL